MSRRREEGMRNAGRARIQRFAAALCAALALACPGGDAPPARGPAEVKVDVARVAPLSDQREYVGNVRAVDRVEVRARVRGYLVEQRYADGALVAKGELLFRIDPEPFLVALAEAKGQLARARADALRAEQDLARADALFKSGVVSTELIDQRRAARNATAAAVEAAQATVKAAELNLSYAEVRAPVAGRMGRRLIDIGNLVGESGTDTILAELVEEDPIHVYFAVPEGEALPRGGSDPKAAPSKIPVRIVLGDGTRYAHEGVVDYVAPTVDPDQGTVSVRARVPNPEGALRPGQFVRVVASFPDVPAAVLIPQRAVLDEQGGSYVLLVGENDTVERRPIRPGRMVDGRQEVREGLKGGERVIIDGVQGVRPGDTVRATTAETRPADDTPAAAPVTTPAASPGAPTTTPPKRHDASSAPQPNTKTPG